MKKPALYVPAVLALALGACQVHPYYFGADAGVNDAPDTDAPQPPDVEAGDDGTIEAETTDECVPIAERCDGLDNDCDGVADNGFDFQNDVNHCGGCPPCLLDNAAARCVAAACQIAACQLGWVDLDGDPLNGCEYACNTTGPESCDGDDNDCDGLIDTADPDLPIPANFCPQIGECAGAMPVCLPAGWRCSYGPTVEQPPLLPGILAIDEAVCDGLDGDCDGTADDSFPQLAGPCTDTGIGACQGRGAYTCNPARDGVTCVISTPGATPGPELCNGRDDDCDSLVDEETDDTAGLGVVDDMVFLSWHVPAFYIYRHEASRPDATANGSGISSSRACGRPGVLPWTSLNFADAYDACLLAGKRLCRADEWLAACAGSAGLSYPYGSAYDPNACNGSDYDADSVAPGNQNFTIPTGAATMCVSPDGVYDMSGNAKEWTDDLRGTAGMPPREVYGVRGGAYDSLPQGLPCSFTFPSETVDYLFPNLGFRCCSDTAP